MRRMYSEQELSKIIKEVFDAEVASGEFDETIADYVDAYLVEHPVDITALEGQDVEVKSLEATDAIKYLSKIIDEDGKSRFLQGNGVPNEDVVSPYCKWSLSGTHLLCVIAGTFEDGTELPAYFTLARFGPPQWVLDKIYPVWASVNIERFTAKLTANDWSTQDLDLLLQDQGSYLQIIGNNSQVVTLTATRSFRIQIDLLID